MMTKTQNNNEGMTSPAAGEVAELVEWLRQEAAEQHPGPGAALPLPSEEIPESKGSESPLSEFGPNDMPLG